MTHFTTETGASELCTLCFNADVAQRSGIDDFDNHPLDPVLITAADGVIHEFHLRTRLLGAIVTLEAYELKDHAPSGYQFQLVGEPDEDRFVQLGRLVERIRRTLATTYLEDGRDGLQIKDMEVKGTIEADLSDEADVMGSSAPMLVIDGRDVSWEEFGRMLMTFEGFQFKLEIVDKSDDLGSRGGLY
ncbi:MAG: hypothetical protein KAY82_06670 [Hylemonella sp.]|nr:hypothetical protein [Hylemonella sp.]